VATRVHGQALYGVRADADPDHRPVLRRWANNIATPVYFLSFTLASLFIVDFVFGWLLRASVATAISGIFAKCLPASMR
jgi:hypothetical protein